MTLRKPMFREEFFAWAEAQDERYEFDGEQPILMTGGSVGHSRLIGRLLAALIAQLEEGPFVSFGPDAGIATIGAKVRYPDAVIAAVAGHDADRLVTKPVAVFEVANPSSSRVDRITKLREYRQVETIRAYVILEGDAPAATVFHKQSDESWQATPLTADDAVSLPAYGVSFTLASLYKGILDPSGS